MLSGQDRSPRSMPTASRRVRGFENSGEEPLYRYRQRDDQSPSETETRPTQEGSPTRSGRHSSRDQNRGIRNLNAPYRRYHGFHSTATARRPTVLPQTLSDSEYESGDLESLGSVEWTDVTRMAMQSAGGRSWSVNEPRRQQDVEAQAGVADSALRFDDLDAEFLSEESDLDWENEQFDYTVPVGRLFLQERNAIECPATRAGAPIGIPRLSSLARRLRHVSSMTATGARNLHGRVIETYNDPVRAVDGAYRMGRHIATTTRQASESVSSEIWRASENTAAVVGDYWPGIRLNLENTLANGASAVVREATRALTPLGEHDGDVEESDEDEEWSEGMGY